MKKNYLFVLSLLISTLSFGQEHLIENFDYGTTQDNLINLGSEWINKVGADDTPLIIYLATSLTMPDYEPVAIGGSAELNIASQPGATGQDLNRQTGFLNGTNYLSALVNVTFARPGGGSDYFLHFNEDVFVPGPDTYSDENNRARVFVRDDGNSGINFGILSAGETADISWDPNSYATKTTYLIVASYDTASGTSKLYVLTTPVANEPAQANASHQFPGVVEINKVSLRQEAYTPRVTIDGLKVVGNWAELWPPLNFPDANLATAMSNLITDTSVDADGDGEISLEEAAAYTGALDFSNLGVDDISGLQYFTSVSELNISGNNITDLSLLFGNESSSASKVSQTKKTSTKSFDGLLVLNCSNNNLTSLDLSGITTLTSLDCSNNQLESLNVNNNNNINFTSFVATGNSSLECIQVDDAAWSTSNWTNIDGLSTFSENCVTLGIADVVKVPLKVFPNPVKNTLNLKSKEILQDVSIYNLLGQEIEVINKESIINNSINVSNYSNGIYFLKVEINSQVQVIKFVKK